MVYSVYILQLLHTKPDLMSSQHATLLKPTVIFSDSIPYSYLTEDFIKTNQLLLNIHTNQSNSAKCFVAAGQFDISDSLSNHMTTNRHGNSQVMLTVEDIMENVLFYMLQILSAISHWTKDLVSETLTSEMCLWLLIATVPMETLWPSFLTSGHMMVPTWTVCSLSWINTLPKTCPVEANMNSGNSSGVYSKCKKCYSVVGSRSFP